MDDTLTIRETAEALGVSIDTVRRWANAGRIEATRTAGGHRRFSIDEVQRLAGRDRRSPGSFRLAPPSRPLPDTARMLAQSGPSLLARATSGLYRNQRNGWFAVEPGRSQSERWLSEVAGAARSGHFGSAVAASRRLARQAGIAGVSTIECDSLVELLGAALAHQLAVAQSQESAAARRLLISLRQSMLSERLGHEKPAVAEL